MKEKNKLVVFQNKKIRRIWHNDEWYFSIVDIVAVLTESVDPTAYWRKLKQRLKEEGNETVTNCHALKMLAFDNKMRLTDVGRTKEIFRLIQSIPSKRAEPFKQWLAQVGYERIEEIENPELGQDRIKEYYELKGYPKEWIDKRLRGIAIRQELTDEWKNREIKTEKEFSILTNEISKATFGKTVGEYKEFKKLQKQNQNLRDHMNDLELIFTMLGEASTTAITKEKDSKGFDKCKNSANKGGNIAKRAREDLEINLGKSVISKDNFLSKQKDKKKLK
ncbi:MAG: Bro-N domain-containing protein [Nanoarchaeota archaeon]|nr:Bro-N domain-containing protein [Nanoarchaeota archaeon]MBU1321680.1 Bro-N domain-containing protein [Nanoarchaeota archaeon]MBU1598079.1 Bro-N domain-containing protein [Nanoarchaeota archaeon]MBU2441629.1 Bro-N domain-containing protein [Nanoarchaeota archaeon]